jgi:hypothetical protein
VTIDLDAIEARAKAALGVFYRHANDIEASAADVPALVAEVRGLEAEVSRVSLRLSMMCDSHDTLEREHEGALAKVRELESEKEAMALAGDVQYRIRKELQVIRDRLIGVIRESGMTFAAEKIQALLYEPAEIVDDLEGLTPAEMVKLLGR